MIKARRARGQPPPPVCYLNTQHRLWNGHSLQCQARVRLKDGLLDRMEGVRHQPVAASSRSFTTGSTRSGRMAVQGHAGGVAHVAAGVT